MEIFIFFQGFWYKIEAFVDLGWRFIYGVILIYNHRKFNLVFWNIVCLLLLNIK